MAQSDMVQKKKIVTHCNPDLDAVASIWLIVRWLPASPAGGPGWETAEFEIVPAGKTYKKQAVNSNSNVLHVDTGLGKLDHHQTDEYTCAAKLTLGYIKSKKQITNNKEQRTNNKEQKGENGNLKITEELNCKSKKQSESHGEPLEWDEETLKRLVEVVNQIDHFQEVYYPDPEADLMEFIAESILSGWKLLYREQDKLVIEKGLDLLDGIYRSLLSKVKAEKILEKEGVEFETRWGKGIAVETTNSQVLALAQKRGYKITVRRHPVGGHVKIKTLPPNFVGGPASSIDLTPIYERLRELDPEASWFLHASKTMVLNGSAKNPGMKPTRLSLGEVVKIIQSI